MSHDTKEELHPEKRDVLKAFKLLPSELVRVEQAVAKIGTSFSRFARHALMSAVDEVNNGK